MSGAFDIEEVKLRATRGKHCATVWHAPGVNAHPLRTAIVTDT